MKIKIKHTHVNIPIGDFFSYSRILEYYYIMQFADINSKDLICDIACGNGFWSEKISRNAERLTGIDYNGKRISQAVKTYECKKNLSFLVADAQSLPIKSKSFTKVVSVCALEHFPSDLQSLREMRRISCKNAVLAMSVDSLSLKVIPESFRSYHSKRYYVHNYFTLESIKDKLCKVGFKVTKHKYLVTSPLSSFINRLASRHRRLFQFLFPLLFPLTVLSDYLPGAKSGGHKLVIKAKAI